MADTRQQYHGWTAKSYGPFRYGIMPRQNYLYWMIGGRAWFGHLRKVPKIGGRVHLVFDHPMAQHRRKR